jgi:hypothetical protein
MINAVWLEPRKDAAVGNACLAAVGGNAGQYRAKLEGASPSGSKCPRTTDPGRVGRSPSPLLGLRRLLEIPAVIEMPPSND